MLAQKEIFALLVIHFCSLYFQNQQQTSNLFSVKMQLKYK